MLSFVSKCVDFCSPSSSRNRLFNLSKSSRAYLLKGENKFKVSIIYRRFFAGIIFLSWKRASPSSHAILLQILILKCLIFILTRIHALILFQLRIIRGIDTRFIILCVSKVYFTETRRF